MPPDTPGASSPDPKDTEIADLKAELAAAQAGKPADAPDAEQAPEPVAPIAALADSVAENPDLNFVGHLENLAEKGIGAVLNPSQQERVVSVLTAIVADLVKVGL